MTFFSSLADYKAYHILSYGTFVGATFFQSFIGGVVAYKTLPRPLFARLQQATFPVFFSIQTVLPVIMAITYPGEKVVGLGNAEMRTNTGLGGVLAGSNFWTVGVPFATILLTSIANLLFAGPLTTKTMKERHHQETRDGKKSYDAGPQSPEMTRLNQRFALLHSVSTILNLMGYGASLYYGFVLGDRI